MTGLARLRRWMVVLRGKPSRYGLAILSVPLSLLIRDAARPLLDQPGYFLFVPAVVLTASIGGLGPGLVSTVLNTAALWYFVVDPKNSFGPMTKDETATLLLFAGTCALISWLFDHRFRSARVQAELVRSLTAKAEHLQAHEAELRRSNQDLERFAHVVAHDLKEPLRTVHMFAQILVVRCSERMPAEARQYLDAVLNGAARMQGLVEDLLTYSVQRTAQNTDASVDMGELVRSVLGDLRAAIEENGAEIELGRLTAVQGDSRRLALLIQNLIGNALKYRSKEKPRIAVSAECAGSECRFLVSDNGVGFDPAYAEQIFQPLKRLHGRETPGTGMGLAICRRIVQAHGGRIWADSRPGQGSRFYFTLPRARIPRSGDWTETNTPEPASPEPASPGFISQGTKPLSRR